MARRKSREVSEETQSKLFESAVVDKWLARIEAANVAKKEFKELADKCYSFFRKDHGFMWKTAFLKKHIGSIEAPRFGITINKAFELVSIFGPQLFWENPFRACKPYEPLEFTAEAFGNPEDPAVQQMFQEAQEEQQWEYSRSVTRCALMEKYLNYSQREQPQGLHFHAQMAITDALIKGRGLLWPEKYKFHSSQRELTGLFFDSVDNFYIDPDCKDPSLDGAMWICRKHMNAAWELEEKFNLPKGVLKGHGNLETIEHATTNQRPVDRIHRANGQTHEIIVWYEIWSKCGVGTRNVGDADSALHEGFEEIVGDFAYLCIAPSVPWFLNAPPSFISGASDDEIRKKFAWPFPSYVDNRWPVATLDFYKDTNSCWPIPPLAPALGELICLNTLVSCFIDQAYENRKSIIAYAESAQQDVEQALAGAKNPALVKINESVHSKVTDMIQYLQRPNMNTDLIQAIEYVEMLFDKRTGLIDRQYGQTSTQSRSARDAVLKDEKANVRPDRMAKDVAAFITEASNLEKLLASWDIKGKNIQPLIGSVGVRLWDQLIGNQDPEVIAREMSATVEASDIRKPNRERDATNLQNMMSIMVPVFQQYAMLTGNGEPLSNFLEDFGKSIEQPTWRWKMGEWVPPSDPNMQQLQMEGAQAEVQNVQADTQLKMAQAQEKAESGQMKQQELQFEAKKGEQELMLKAAEAQMDMQVDIKKAQIEMQVEQQKAQMEMASAAQKMQMDHAEFQQNLRQQRIEGNERYNQQKLQGELRLRQKKAESANPKGGGSKK